MIETLMRPLSIRTLLPSLGSTLLLMMSGLCIGSAQAQDVFGMLEAHAAMSAQAQYAADAHSRYSSRYDDNDRGSSSRPAPRKLSPEELKELEDYSKKKQAEEDAKYQRWLNGSWDFFQSREPAEPGEWCTAMYQNRDGIIALSGFDKSWDGALLMFTGEKIPQPRKFREITATLTQTGDAPAKVQVYNYARDPRMHKFGTLVFAVPTMKAALAGMTDELEFAIAIDDKEVFRMAWKEGLKAADELRKCVRKR
ncbi:hypothetical protein DFR24_2890 [Panacagrimonas perspica]|uniref:Uncharacterized protein n=1 Tax=Panacagrimonas perspica TaxID=381431 RepID=A0A4S3JZP6_9GAMM|nr:hypothetical protein [Panacagrimonas perspica]TDU28518.1 hypothetical protein DFR24_2890 [Panacagrimonas perspica]THD00914.1 hypothetical protein B1810_22720 [Panacagrimonas perspica]